MHITYELTAEDIRTCHAMLRAASPPPTNRMFAIAVTIYGGVGIITIGYIFDISMWALIAFGWFSVGLSWLLVFGVKLATAKQLAQSANRSSMRREYLLNDDSLEVRMADLTQLFPLKNILRLESGKRATLVHLAKSAPSFLPFGSEFRSDFIDALQAKIKNGG